jgi:membrane protein DedA with SNARE-associated domain
MQDFMLNFVNHFGYLGIFFLISIENIFPPIPSEAVLLFGGALTVGTTMKIPYTILAATAGSLAGAIILYALGYIFQAPRLKRLFAGKFGQTLHLKPEYVDSAEHWFVKYEIWAVLICRCIPLMRSLISIPAGIAKMKIPQFLFLTILGSTIWNTLLIYTGAGLGTAWQSALPYFDRYTNLALILLAALAVLLILAWQFSKHRKKAPPAP